MSIELSFVERAFDNGLDAVAAYDRGLRISYWNSIMAEVSEIPAVSAVGVSAYDLFPRLREEGQDRAMRDALGGDQKIVDLPFFAGGPGEEFEWFVAPLHGRGEVVGGVAVARSRLRRGSLEQRLAETEQRFRGMADSSPVLLWMSGTDGMCNFFNQTWLAFSGRPMEAELGVGWAEGVHPVDFEHCMNTYNQHFARREAFEMIYRLRRHDGAYRWILDRGVPRFTPDGAFAGFIGSCVDITDRKNAEDDAVALAQRLTKANEQMERLLYATSHDLREPIRLVTSFLDLLERRLEGELDERTRSYLRFSQEGAQRMRTTVDGLLDLARVRRQGPELTEVDVGALVEAVRSDLRAAIDQANAAIEVGPMPTLTADESRLRAIFLNLLGNAVKFRAEAPAVVRVTAQRSGDAWLFAVRDNGVGFEDKYAERVFEMFERLHRRELYPGDGVGLAIVREAVQVHGGRVWAQSAPGQGSTFFFTVPVPP